jgi:hypothetical protein
VLSKCEHSNSLQAAELVGSLEIVKHRSFVFAALAAVIVVVGFAWLIWLRQTNGSMLELKIVRN